MVLMGPSEPGWIRVAQGGGCEALDLCLLPGELFIFIKFTTKMIVRIDFTM